LRPLIAGSVALAVALVGALIAVVFLLPVLVDREAIEARLERDIAALTGGRLAMEGLEVQLLPRPRVVVAGAALEEVVDARGRPALTVERLELDVRAMSLLAGELVIDEARLVRPEFRSPAQAAGTLAGLDRLLLRTVERLTIHALAIEDGRLLLAAGTAAEVALSDIYLDWRRRGIPGGSRGAIELRHAGSRIEGEAELGTLSDDGAMTLRTRWRVHHEGGAVEAVDNLAYRGAFRLRPNAETGANGAQRLNGRLELGLADPAVTAAWLESLLGRPVAAPATTEAVRLRGELALDGHGLSLDPLTLELGEQRLRGRLAAGLGGVPHLDVALEGGVVALDAVLETVPDAPALLFDVPGRLPRGLEGGLTLDIAALETAAGTWRPLRLESALAGDGRIRLERLTLGLPGAGRLDFSGEIGRGGDGPGWRGSLELASDDLPSLLAALDRPLPAGPLALPERVDLTGQVELERDRLALRSAELRFDASRARGGLVLVRDDPTRLAVSARIDRLGLDRYITGPLDGAAFSRLGEALAGIDHAFDLSLDRATLGRARFENMALESRREDEGRARWRLAFAGLGGSSLGLEGGLDLATGGFSAEGDVNIASMTRLLRLLDIDPPATLALAGPFLVKAEVRGDGRATELELDLEADSLGGDIALRLTPTLNPERFSLDLAMDGPDAQRLLRELGGVALAGDVFAGPARLDARIEGTPGGNLETELEAGLGDLVLEAGLTRRFAGEGAGEGETVEGTLRLAPVSADLLDRLYRGLRPRLGLVPGPPSQWPGAWPETPFVWRWPEDRRYDLDLSLVPGGDEPAARIGLEIEDGRARFDPIDLPLAGGRLTGRAELTDGADEATRFETALTFEEIALDGLLDRVAGRLGGELEATSRGRSIAELVAGLEGEGRFRLEDGRLRGVRAGEGAALAADTDAELAFAALGGGLRIDRGTVIGEGLSLELGNHRHTLDLHFDLASWILEGDIEAAAGEEGGAILRAIGPPDDLDIRRISPPAAE